ncbi:TIGR03943 family protein [Clostridium chromiireducens]|uniref:TIGR03943 family protein n=1 Tax=Clostridium chromiireducens TaxID=225345 RepID=A0A399IQ44_9CLOT|nr:TIGR03943 family protein [Clostridium chromiireducens]RII33056.1 TIGR03943 family protein [Clostridium chromiireducens]
MKKLNLDIIVKTSILLSLSIFYFRIILTNEIVLYVHPRIIPFAVFGMISMLVIALFLLGGIFNTKKKKLKFKNYIVFIIPLIMIFFMQTINTNSSANASDINSNSSLNSSANPTLNANSSSSFDIYSGKSESDDQGKIDKKELDIKNGIIEVTLNNFVFSLDEILSNPNKYMGKEIEISGFVYRDKALNENEFIIGRFMMVCCAADMQIAGIVCDNNNLQTYDNNTWIKVKGKIQKTSIEGDVEPIIVLEHIEKDSNPDTSYVYPF